MQLMTSGTCSSGDSGRGHVLPSRIDLSSEDVDMKKWFGLSVIVYLRSPSTMLCSVLAASPGAMMCSAHGEDLVVENAFIPKRVEGNPIYDSVTLGTNQLEHFAMFCGVKRLMLFMNRRVVIWGLKAKATNQVPLRLVLMVVRGMKSLSQMPPEMRV